MEILLLLGTPGDVEAEILAGIAEDAAGDFEMDRVAVRVVEVVKEGEMLSLPDTPGDVEGVKETATDFEVDTAGDFDGVTAGEWVALELEPAGELDALGRGAPGELDALGRGAPGDGEAGTASKGLAYTTRKLR